MKQLLLVLSLLIVLASMVHPIERRIVKYLLFKSDGQTWLTSFGTIAEVAEVAGGDDRKIYVDRLRTKMFKMSANLEKSMAYWCFFRFTKYAKDGWEIEKG